MATALLEAIQQPAPITVRTNPAKSKLEPSVNRIPWSSNGFYLNQRPLFTADPLFHAGAYYVQEASSMFVEQVFKQHVETERPLTVLDLCAAPGGKSTLLSSLLKPNDVLLCNEVNKTRADILTENIQKWGNTNVVISRNDPADFATLPPLFDCILVDAPCSGTGAIRKSLKTITIWNQLMVTKLARQQKELIVRAFENLKPGGEMVYSTCSVEPEENEGVVDHLLKTFPSAKIISAKLPGLKISKPVMEFNGEKYNPQIKNTLRIWPQDNDTEGFFVAKNKKLE
jgi:NOL1/NOP2/sun family putative RNA methylase